MRKINLFIFCMVFLFGCVARQDVINLDNRLSRLERINANLEKELNATKDNLDSRVAALSDTRKEQDLEFMSQSAGIQVKIDRLKEELRILNGRLEELQHQFDRELGAFSSGPTRVGQMVAFNDQRLARVEKYLNLEPAKMKSSQPFAPVSETEPPSEAVEEPKEFTEADQYIAAKQAFDQGKYEEARSGFEALLKKHPNSPRADNAQFWIGETYYQERWYEKAILEYQKVIEKYSKGNKVPAAMLKQGFAFLNLGDKASARLTLKDLVNKYPSSNEAAVARQKLGEL